MLSIVSLISVPSIYHRPKDHAVEADSAKRKFIHSDGDHLTMLNTFNAFINKGMNADWCWENYLNFRALKQANDIRNQLVGMVQRLGLEITSTPTSNPNYDENIKKCLLSGFFM